MGFIVDFMRFFGALRKHLSKHDLLVKNEFVYQKLIFLCELLVRCTCFEKGVSVMKLAGREGAEKSKIPRHFLFFKIVYVLS